MNKNTKNNCWALYKQMSHHIDWDSFIATFQRGVLMSAGCLCRLDKQKYSSCIFFTSVPVCQAVCSVKSTSSKQNAEFDIVLCFQLFGSVCSSDRCLQGQFPLPASHTSWVFTEDSNLVWIRLVILSLSNNYGNFSNFTKFGLINTLTCYQDKESNFNSEVQITIN